MRGRVRRPRGTRRRCPVRMGPVYPEDCEQCPLHTRGRVYCILLV